MRPPAWFRVVAVVLILWGLIGCFTCYQQFRLGADAMGNATDYYRQLWAAMPSWYIWCYAAAVGLGLLGAIALLLRLRAARVLFVASLTAVIVQFGYVFLATDLLAHKGAAATVPFPLLIVAIGAFEVWLAGHGERRGWLNRG